MEVDERQQGHEQVETLGTAEGEDGYSVCPLFINRNDLGVNFGKSEALRVAGGLVDADDTASSSGGEDQSEKGQVKGQQESSSTTHPRRRIPRSVNGKIFDASTGVFRKVPASGASLMTKTSRGRRRAREARRTACNLSAGQSNRARRKSKRQDKDSSLGQVQVFLSMLGVDK